MNMFTQRRNGRIFLQKLGFLRLVGIAIATVLLLGSLLALPVLTQQPVTVKFLAIALEAEQFQPLVKQFEAQHPDIHIDIIEGPNATNALEDLYTSSFLLGDSPYDLIYMDIVWVPKFAAAGWLADLSDRVTDEELAAFMPADVNGGRYQGGLYRMPFRSDVGMLYYRKDLLEAAGDSPPETFNDLLELSQKLQSDSSLPWGNPDQTDASDTALERWGYVWQGKQYEGLAAMFVEILAGHGGFWVDPATGDVGLDRPEAIAAVQFLLDTVNTNVSPPAVTSYQEVETLRAFKSGNTLFLRNWPYVWPEVNKADSPLRGKVALKPMVYAQGQTSGACQGGWGFGIAKSSKHPDAAWKVVQFLTSAEAQRQYVLDYGYVPSRRALYTDAKVVAQYPHYPELLKVAENAVLRPPIPQYAQASDILQRYLSAAVTQQLSPEKAMKRAAGETRRLLGRYTASNSARDNAGKAGGRRQEAEERRQPSDSSSLLNAHSWLLNSEKTRSTQHQRISTNSTPFKTTLNRQEVAIAP